MTEIIERADVARILADPRFLVPEADAAAASSFERFRARVSRFANGAVHDERRARLEGILATLEPRALAEGAATRTRRILDEDGGAAPEVGADTIVRHVPVATLADELGFRDPDLAPALVARVAHRYAMGQAVPASDAAADDSATERLLAASGATGDDADLLVQLLVQAYAATGALVTGALRRLAASDDADADATTTHELLRTTLRDDSPVPSTRRVAPDGTLIVLRLDGPDGEAGPAHEPRTLAFGDGPRACPAPHHALAIAAAIVDELRRVRVEQHDPSTPTSRSVTRGGVAGVDRS